jgi:hypothetical protein
MRPSAIVMVNPLPQNFAQLLLVQRNHVIEFRRYTIRDGERKHFAQYFETYFPEAFQQLGALAIGQFFERHNQGSFTWFRAFPTMDDRVKANAEFYYGPLWKEHKTTLNNLMVDSDNVLLLRPLHPEKGVTVLPAVDPVAEPDGAQGVVVAQIFAIRKSVKCFTAAMRSSTFVCAATNVVPSSGISIVRISG